MSYYIYTGNSLTEYQCPNSTQCISRVLVCNGQYDCMDGSDELGCVKCDTITCVLSANGREICIPSSWECDGTSDCTNNTDESSCKYIKYIYMCVCAY